MPLGESLFAASLCIPLLPTQPPENTAFRGTLACLGIVLSGVSGYLIWVEKFVWLRWMSIAYAVSATCWLSLATLDADSLRNGDSLCENNFKLSTSTDSHNLISFDDHRKLSCKPDPFIWLTVADYATVCAFAAVAYAWWTYATASLKGPAEPQLNDPFLTGATSGGSSSPYEKATSEPALYGEMA